MSVIDIRDAKSLRMILWKKRLCEVERGRRKRREKDLVGMKNPNKF